MPGIVYNDVVRIGSAVVENMAVQAARRVTDSFSSMPEVSGLLGLAYDKGSTVHPHPRKTWFTSVKDSLAAPLFTVWLRAGKPGAYNFGGIGKSGYTGDITYTDTFPNQLGNHPFASSGCSIGDNKFVKLPSTPLPTRAQQPPSSPQGW